jgi:hypothetical protein
MLYEAGVGMVTWFFLVLFSKVDCVMIFEKLDATLVDAYLSYKLLVQFCNILFVILTHRTGYMGARPVCRLPAGPQAGPTGVLGRRCTHFVLAAN